MEKKTEFTLIPPTESFLKNDTWMRFEGLPFDIYRSEEMTNWIPHIHEFQEIVLILKGSIEHVIYGNHIHAAAGDVFSVPPGIEHGYSNVNDCSLISVIFTKEFISERHPEFLALPEFGAFMHLEHSLRKDKSMKEFLKLAPKDLIYLNDILRRIEAELSQKELGYAIACEAGLTEFLVAICRRYTEDVRMGAGTLINVARAISRMEAGYADPIELDELVSLSCMSKRSFIRHFSRSTGITPMKFLAQVRITQARRLLKESECNVTEIASLVGYEDSSHFTQVFKALTGMSPLEYRNTGFLGYQRRIGLNRLPKDAAKQ